MICSFLSCFSYSRDGVGAPVLSFFSKGGYQFQGNFSLFIRQSGTFSYFRVTPLKTNLSYLRQGNISR